MKQTSVYASLTWLLSRSFSIYSARNRSTRFSRKPGSEMSVCLSVCHSQVDCWQGSTLKQPDSPPRIIGISIETDNSSTSAKPSPDFHSRKALNWPTCLLYTSDAADEEDSVDLGGRRIIKKKKQ